MPVEPDPAALNTIIDDLVRIGGLQPGRPLFANDWNRLVRSVAALATQLGGREVDWETELPESPSPSGEGASDPSLQARLDDLDERLNRVERRVGDGTGPTLPSGTGGDVVVTIPGGSEVDIDELVRAIRERDTAVDQALKETREALADLDAVSDDQQVQIDKLEERVKLLEEGDGRDDQPDDGGPIIINERVIDDLRKEVKDALDSSATELSSLRSRVTAVEAEVKRLAAFHEDEGGRLTFDLDELRDRLTRFDTRFDDLSGRITTATERADTNLRSLEDVRSRLEIATNGLSNVGTRVDDLSAELGRVSTGLGDVRTTLNTRLTDLGDLRVRFERAESTVSDLSTWRGATDARIEAINTGAGGGDVELAGRIGEVAADLRGRIDEVSLRVERLGTDIGGLDSRLDSTEISLANLDTGLDGRIKAVTDSSLRELTGRTGVVETGLVGPGRTTTEPTPGLTVGDIDLRVNATVDRRLAGLATTTELTELGVRVGTVEGAISALDRGLDARITSGARSVASAIETRMGTLEQGLSSIGDSVRTLESGLDLRIRNGATTALSERLVTAETAIGELSSWRAGAEARMTAISAGEGEGDVELAGRLGALEERFESRVGGLESRVEANATTLTAFEARVGGAERSVERLGESVETRLGALSRSVETTRVTLANTSTDMERLSASLGARVDALDSAVKTNTSALGRVNGSVATLREEFSARNASVDASLTNLRGLGLAGPPPVPDNLTTVIPRNPIR